MSIKPLVIIDSVLRALNPTPPVGGLSISDGVVRFLSIKDKTTLVTASLRLPPGIVTNKVVTDKDGLRAALVQLHRQVAAQNELVHVVLLLPPGLAHAQVFSVPALSDKRLEEAAKLNLQMISPIEVSNAYMAWERVGSSGSAENGQIDLLGAFVEAAPVNDLTMILNEAGFSTVAVEFPSLALARLLRRSQAYVGETDACVSIEVGTEGISLMVLRRLDLYFSHFHSWSAIREELGVKTIAREDVVAFLTKEVRKLFNFYASKWGGSVGGVILFASSLKTEITGAITKMFNVPVKPLTLKDFPDLDPLWFPVLGAALRGTFSGNLDRFISLTNAPVQVQYERARLLNFALLWTRLALVTTAVVVIVAVGVDSLLARIAAHQGQPTQLQPEQIALATSLEAKVRSFNARAKLLKVAVDRAPKSASFASILLGVTSQYQIIVSSVSVTTKLVSLAGVAPSEAALFAFKAAIAKTPGVTGVDLPLDAIAYKADGSADFTIRFSRTAP